MNKVIVIEGSLFERKRILNKIKDSFTSDYDTIVFDSKDHYNYVSQSLTEVSCFGCDKLYIMKELPKIEAPTAAQERSKVLGRLKKLFSSIPAGNILVLDNIGISAKSFLTEVEKYGQTFISEHKISKAYGINIVNDYFKNRSIILYPEVSQLLVDSLNLNGDDIDIDKLNLTMLKFYHHIYGKNKVTKDDVYAVCSSSKEFVIWSLYNMLDDISSSQTKYIGSAVSLINDFLSNAKYFEHEAVMIIKNMIWRYGLLLLAKNGVNDQKSQKEINQQISNIIKLESHGRSFNIKMEPKLVKEVPTQEYSSKMINSVMNSYHGAASLSCYNYNQLLLIYYTLVKMLIKVRSGCTESEIKISMSMIIAVICGEITKKNTIDGVLEHKRILYGIDK